MQYVNDLMNADDDGFAELLKEKKRIFSDPLKRGNPRKRDRGRVARQIEDQLRALRMARKPDSTSPLATPLGASSVQGS